MRAAVIAITAISRQPKLQDRAIGGDRSRNGLRNESLLALAVLLLGGVLFSQPTVRTVFQNLVNGTLTLARGDVESSSEQIGEQAGEAENLGKSAKPLARTLSAETATDDLASSQSEPFITVTPEPENTQTY